MLLGIDTGGTYTDAVLYDEQARVVRAAAKSPTTHHDLAIGVCGAIDGVLATGICPADRIELVSMSTTLATNALVEGKGRAVGAIVIGFDVEVVERAGLAEALGNDPVVFLAGGHDPHGGEVARLDLERLEAEVRAMDPRVESFAVTAQFSVRNPEHELVAAGLIQRVTGKPVTLSHHLSARLNGPKRAVTAILNARLISIIDQLVHTTEIAIAERGIDAPLMVVRGDGSLVSAAFVRERPIETILSGPAASLVGAAHLTALDDAIISDIGGTTTDVAVLTKGVPTVSPDGATVGGHQTMVSAVAMHTHGLGGDSRVRHDERSAGAVLTIGPRKVIPICQLAVSEPELVHRMLDLQLTHDFPGEFEGIVLVSEARDAWLPRLEGVERAILEAMGGRVAVADVTLNTLQMRRVLDRLVQRGIVQIAAFTPTDAAHVLGLQSTYDVGAAVKVATLFARGRDRTGKAIAADAETISRITVTTLVRRSAEAVLAAAFVDDGMPAETVRTPVVQAVLDRRLSTVRLGLGLAAPLVGLGASAPAYYPMVAELLGAESRVPEHAGVANAVGAVVGRVRLVRECVISSPSQGQYVVHAGETPAVFTDLERARAFASEHAGALLDAEMRAAGADEFEVVEDWVETTVPLSGAELFVEGRLTLSASGRPHLNHHDAVGRP